MTSSEAEIHSSALDQDVRSCYGCRWWLQKPISQQQRQQHFGTMQAFSGLLTLVESVSRSCSCASEARYSDELDSWCRAAHDGVQSNFQRLAYGLSGCTHGISTVGSIAIVYFTPSAQIN